jgi:hypothetical protein
LRLPVGANPKPEQLTYPGARKILMNWVDDLQKAEATLVQVTDPEVKLPLHFGLIRLDFDGDGQATEEETLWRLYSRFNPRSGVTPEAARSFVIGFDRGDVHWLRGYCHLLMAMAEFALAHDGQEIFDCTAHLFFPRVDTPHEFLVGAPKLFDIGSDIDVVDVIALVHLIRMPVREPERTRAALTHLESMVAQSKESWKFILAETDDDHEWIPNPRQAGVIPNVRVTKEMVAAWQEFLNEAEALLAGKKLVPFWRSKDGRGVNLRRVFTEPRSFDLVLWVQGTAATPYLERGPLTQPEVWQRLQRVFGGEFLGFALWFN